MCLLLLRPVPAGQRVGIPDSRYLQQSKGSFVQGARQGEWKLMLKTPYSLDGFLYKGFQRVLEERVSRMPDQTVALLHQLVVIAGWYSGNLNHQSSSLHLRSWVQHVVTTFHGVGASFCRTPRHASDCYLYPSLGSRSPVTLLFLIINCLSLFSVTQGRPRRPKPFNTKQKGRTWRGFCIQEGPAGCLWFQFAFSFDTPQSWE